MKLVELNQFKVDYCLPGKGKIEGDIQKILLDISQSEEYKAIHDKVKANVQPQSPWATNTKNVPIVHWDGTFINGCITSYTGFVAVKTITPSSWEVDIESVKKIPYLYAFYRDISDDKDLVLICKHDNTDVIKHHELCQNIMKDLENRLGVWLYTHPGIEIMISYDPDMYMSSSCDSFHFHDKPKDLRQTKPITKDKYDALSLDPANSLQDISDEVHQFFTLDRKNSINAAARYYAYRAKQSGFGDMESYQAFLNMLDGPRYGAGSGILMEFGEVYK